MKALALYEPLFQYLCRLNRLGRKGYQWSYGEVRKEITALLSNIRTTAEKDPSLREHERLLRSPMNYVIDGCIVNNRHLSFGEGQWHEKRLGYHKDGLAGDEAFFTEHLEPALRETPSVAGAERLLVYYTALGLGFQGYYFRRPDKLRAYMKAMEPAVHPWLVDNRTRQRLVPQAYEATDRRNLARPPRIKRSVLAAGLIALLLSAVPLYWWLAHSVVQRADEQIHLREVSESHQGAP